MKKNLLVATALLQVFAAAAQSPGGISTGLRAWLKADAGTSTSVNGAPVSYWNDQSGGGRNHTQTVASKQPAYVAAGNLINYNPALRFTGISDGNISNDFMSASNYLATSEAFHVFTVSRITTAGNGTSWRTTYSFQSDYTHTDWFNEQASCRTQYVEKPNTSKKVRYGLAAHLMPKTGSQRIIWNGTSQSFSNTVYSITNSISPTFMVGVDRNNTNPMVGDIQEVIVYAGTAGADMTTAQIQQIQSYLAIKYGITLDPAGQPNYVASDGITNFWTGAGNTGYQNNIFGLGLDSGSALNQRQAFSYPDSSMSIYLGSSLATLNSANGGSIAANNSFLMMGDNGAIGSSSNINYAIGTSFANGPTISVINTISNRIWKAQATTQTSWTVNINPNKYASATYVLVSSSPTFTAGITTRAYPVIAGMASNVVINHGDYVTFAGFANGPGGIGLNLAVWLRADAGTNTTTSNTAVTSWADQSGNNRTHTQATVAKQPKYAGIGSSYLMNYNPAIRFDGGDDINPASQYFNSTDAFHTFTVSRINGAGATSWQSIASFYVDYNHSDWYLQQASCRTGAIEKNNTSKTVKYALASSLMPKTGSQTVIWNGTPASFSNSAYTLNFPSAPYNFYSIGSDAGTDYLNGDIQEVIIYGGPNVTISANDVERIQSYLAIKYGISLSPTGQPNYTASNNATQFWTGASNTGYQNNIFGLGRDDNSSLEQEQAYAIEDSSLSVYLGNILAPLNSLNGNTIPQNYSFMMLGDNNLNGFTAYGTHLAGTAFSNGVSTSILTNRSNRIWKSQTTTQDSWTVNMNTNKFAAGTNPSVTSYIMVSTTAAFTPVNTRLYPIVNGTATNVVVNNAEFISIGTFTLSPGAVSDGLTLWTRSDDGAAAGSISSWKDNSINLNPVEVTGSMSLSGANTAHNFHPYYSAFTNTNHFYDPASSLNGTGVVQSDFSIFSAIRPDASAPGGLAPGSAGRIVGVDDDQTYSAEPGFSLASNKTLVFYKYTGVEDWKYSTATTTPSKSSVVSFNGSNTAPSATALKIGLDGRDISVARSGTFNMVHQRMRIGYGAWYGTAFPGDIMEVIWYNKSLTTDESNRVTSYLAIKNGVTLGNTTTPVNYVNTSSATVWAGNTTFQNHIAGIGRDDIEVLHQKQSTSVNPNANGQVIMSLGSKAASNAANSTTINKDQTYMIWGDNGVTTPLATSATAFTYAGSSLNQRANRIWMVQNTNLGQTVQITIPISMLGTTGNAAINTSCQKLRMITSSDAGIATITATASLTTSGTDYVCNYIFPAGTSYFTFGRLEEATEGNTYIPYVTTPSVYNSDCEEEGWRYWYADGTLPAHSGTQKIFAIHRNGNGNNTTLNNFTGTVNYNQGPFPYEVTDGVHTTSIMSRTLTVNGGAGPYTINGGMKVRFYVDSSEILSTILPDAISSKWFKHDNDEAATLIDQTVMNINNATFYPSVTSGIEDGNYYIEYSNIRSFSTFGFASNAGSTTALPLELLNFNAIKLENGHVKVTWKTAEEKNISHFEVQRSSDSKTWTSIGDVPANNKPAGDNYNYTDMTPVAGKSYYRLQINGYKGTDVTYSPVRIINNSANAAGSYSVYPNPAGDRVSLSWNSEQMQPTTIKLYNVQGQLQSVSSSREDAQITFNIASLPAGIYYLTLQDKAGHSYNKMIRKQ